MTETLRIDNGLGGIVGKEARAVDGTGFKITDDSGINGVHVKDTGDVDISIAGKTTTAKGDLTAVGVISADKQMFFHLTSVE
jgi:hypothetical protein